MVDIHSLRDPQQAAQHAASAVSKIIEKYSGTPVLFLVSGGSALEILKYLPEDFPDRVTVSVTDDRFSDDPKINNFTQIMKLNARHWIDTRPITGETVEDAGRRFDTALKAWRGNNPTGKIVITQGIGLDGHTVGMMPGCIFNDPAVWAVGYDCGNKNNYPLRVTTTMPFLRMVDDSVLFVCGENKREALLGTLSKEGSLATTPARIIHEMKHCLLFTDQPIDTLLA